MHQVDRRIGLQQPPPGALARVRLAGDQQHPQPVAHAVDLDHRAVVELETSPGSGLARHLDDRRAGAGDRNLDPLLDADRHALALRTAAPSRRMVRVRGVRLWPSRGPQIVDGDAQRDAICRRCRSRAPRSRAAGGRSPRLAGQQQIERRAAAARCGDVVNLAVGDGDGAGEAGPRDVGQAPGRLRRTGGCPALPASGTVMVRSSRSGRLRRLRLDRLARAARRAERGRRPACEAV